MSKVSVMSLEKARREPVALAYFDGADRPLHLHLHELAPGSSLLVEAREVDHVMYVWRGGVEAGDIPLAAGSSAIIEHGRELLLTAAEGGATVLDFSARAGAAQGRIGGHVHLLPTERVPRTPEGSGGAKGGMHADSGCATCEVWLHENHFPGSGPLAPEVQAQGVHSHTEDEIIFVTDGQIRLGSRLCGPGTALAIAADTLYSFTAGPEGLSFVNFRASKPGDIRFASGKTMSETGYWRDLLPRPEYVELA